MKYAFFTLNFNFCLSLIHDKNNKLYNFSKKNKLQKLNSKCENINVEQIPNYILISTAF